MDDNTLQKHVNSSGFPLQIGIAHQVEQQSPGWRVLSTEHPWYSKESKGASFIDIVLERCHGIRVLSLECKRVRDTAWIFLVPSKTSKNVERVSSIISYEQPGWKRTYKWEEVYLEPSSMEAKFCVIPGEGPRQNPMLERISADIIEATEALAAQERELFQDDSAFKNVRRGYHPIIITTAEIKVCEFNPEDVNVNTGEIDTAEFESVPFVRFRKAFSLNSDTAMTFGDLGKFAQKNEKTVLIINAAEFTGFLNKWLIE